MAFVAEIKSGRDEEKVANAFARGASYVIIRCADWKVIPLENIISKMRSRGKVVMEVRDHTQARLALETLELGSDGVLLNSSDPEEIVRTREVQEEEITMLDLAEVEVTKKKEIGLGARVCVDTTDLMASGEGLLVGCQSSGLVLVQAEVEENPYISSRPFRVNAGSISQYILSGRDGTNYLSELEAGHPLLVINREGKARRSCVGRVKIERRPLILVEATWQGREIKAILQNAETIRLVTTDGSKSVTDLEPGSLILAHVEQGGRHFGKLVTEESIIEK
jgi:3-dehydroquinate synthase II